MVASSELWWICSSTISGSGIRLAPECRRREAFVGSVRSVRNALTNYRREILDCVGEERKALARMGFSGIYTGT
jgi:hypothetical protein